jgi:glucose/arabinose dehydrogenase
MHTGGCSHGNLFWRNLLVRQGPDGLIYLLTDADNGKLVRLIPVKKSAP